MVPDHDLFCCEKAGTIRGTGRLERSCWCGLVPDVVRSLHDEERQIDHSCSMSQLHTLEYVLQGRHPPHVLSLLPPSLPPLSTTTPLQRNPPHSPRPPSPLHHSPPPSTPAHHTISPLLQVRQGATFRAAHSCDADSFDDASSEDEQDVYSVKDEDSDVYSDQDEEQVCCNKVKRLAWKGS